MGIGAGYVEIKGRRVFTAGLRSEEVENLEAMAELQDHIDENQDLMRDIYYERDERMYNLFELGYTYADIAKIVGMQPRTVQAKVQEHREWLTKGIRKFNTGIPDGNRRKREKNANTSSDVHMRQLRHAG